MDDQTTQPSAQRSMNPMIIVGVIVLLLLLGGGIYFASQKSSSKDVMQQKTAVEATPTSVPTETTQQATPTASTAKVMEVTVNAGSFYFKPNKITVKKGQEVKLTFVNDGGMHDFVIDELQVKTDVIGSGKSTTVTFTPDKVGTFTYYCSVANHRAMGMTGTLVVE